MAQQKIRFGLIATAVALEPFDDVIVKPDRHRALGGPVESANFGAGPIDDLRHFREINRGVGFGGDRSDIPFASDYELLHMPFFPF
jgi:hypothetical protein